MFTYMGRTYASIPVLPIHVGSTALVIRASIGFIAEGLRFRKHVGHVETISFPGTATHHWWSYHHGVGYVQPQRHELVFQLVFVNGDIGIFSATDLLNVTWLSRDVHPASLPSELPNFS